MTQVTDEAKKQAIQAGASVDSLRIADIEETAVPIWTMAQRGSESKLLAMWLQYQPPNRSEAGNYVFR